MLTKQDLQQIKLVLVNSNALLLKEFEEVKEELGEIKSEIEYLPTKEEYFSSMDKLTDEVKKFREEQTVIFGQLSEHTDRIEKLEEKANITA